MSKKISELTAIDSVTGKEIIPVLIDKDNRVLTVDNIKNYVNSGTNEFIAVKDKDSQEDYRLYVKNGELTLIKETAFSAEAAQEGDNKLYDGLIINQMYGAGLDATVTTPVSHSFIELYNFKEEEVNLKGLYLWYRAKAGNWQSLELVGTIPPKHSFLIRGKQQTKPYDDSVRVPIIDYDMQWDIAFSSQGFSAYLCIGNQTPEDNPVRKVMDPTGTTVASENKRYIDLLAAGGKKNEETVWAYETRYLHCMDKNTGIRRVDFANSGKLNIGSNALVKGNNEADCEPIDFTNCDPEKYRPRSLRDGRWTEFFDKDKQRETSPSMVNISFDKLGTGRCFCFHTPVSTEGYVYYRKQGETLWKVVETERNIIKDMDGSSTVHKCKILNLEVGMYEYKFGYDGCWSDVSTFEIKDYSQTTQNLKMLWTTDQQSWTIREYDVWKVVCRYLRQNDGYRNYDFHLNTGDISQNANRSFEWRLYYRYAGELTRNMPHMITCGNNDLISKKYSDAYKNYIYEDDSFFTSAYAYDVGYTHFVCLNSNTDSSALKSAGGPYDSHEDFLQAEADWLDRHLTEVEARETKPRWVIVYAHLSPFTVGRTIRLQRWVAPVEKHKVDLFLCGHNHAYARSKALYTGFDYSKSPAYNDYVTKVSSGSTELKIVDEFKGDGVTEINRVEDKANGTVYILNQACGL